MVLIPTPKVTTLKAYPVGKELVRGMLINRRLNSVNVKGESVKLKNTDRR